MVPVKLLASILGISSAIPSVLGAAVPSAPPSWPLNIDELNRQMDAHPMNSTASGLDFFDSIMNDPQVPWDGEPPSIATDKTPLEKRAKAYNYIKFKVTLSGEIGHLHGFDFTTGAPLFYPGSPIPFRATSADLYVFDKFRRNARDMLLIWREPYSGQALPGSTFLMTNRRLYKFIYPGDTTEPVLYDDGFYVKWKGYNDLYASFDYTPGGYYNGRCIFSARNDWLLGWGNAEVVRSGDFRVQWPDEKNCKGWVYVKSLGYPIDHYYYIASFTGKVQAKGSRVL
ncbi:hypothetical protein TWF696_001670 [Orbilia brochopaga]|uniref:Uncharacterized protein n=1 Tax=Orbilia brochopaga TaxID=3140254 RepID=A0AAV9U5M0_9PEZI